MFINTEDYWMVPTIILFIFISVSMLFIGGEVERKKIYDRCMENNKVMVHEDTVKLCKAVIGNSK